MSNVERSLGTWFAEGPERAPAGLLSATLAATSRTSQRPALLAVALGAPSAAERIRRRVDLRVAWLVVALALAALATLLILVGLPRPSLVVAPSPAATPAASGPAATAAASPFAELTPSPTVAMTPNPNPYTVADWGITIEQDPTTPWQAVEAGFDDRRVGMDVVADQIPYVLMSVVDRTSLDFFFGSCSADGCERPLITLSLARNGAGLLVGTTSCASAPANLVLDCLASKDVWPITINGKTLAALKQDWLASFSDATATQISLGGERAIILANGGRRTVLAIHGDVLIAVITQPLGGSMTDEEARALESVIANLRFDDLPAASPTSPQ